MDFLRKIWNREEYYPYLISGEIKDMEIISILAARCGFILLLKYLRWSTGRVLLESVRFGQLESVKLLLDNQANIHVGYQGSLDGNYHYLIIDNDAPLELAIQNDQFEIVKYLIQRGAYVQNTSLSTAAKTGNIRLVKYLSDMGWISNRRRLIFDDSTLEDAIVNNVNSEMFRFLLGVLPWPLYRLGEALKDAIKYNRVELAQILIKKGAKIKRIDMISVKTQEMKDLLEDHPETFGDR